MTAAREKLTEINSRATDTGTTQWEYVDLVGSILGRHEGTTDWTAVATTVFPEVGKFVAAARTDVPAVVELLISILDYVEEFKDVTARFEDGRVDPIMVGIKMATGDVQQRFDLFAVGQPVVIPPVTS